MTICHYCVTHLVNDWSGLTTVNATCLVVKPVHFTALLSSQTKHVNQLHRDVPFTTVVFDGRCCSRLLIHVVYTDLFYVVSKARPVVQALNGPLAVCE